MDDDDEVVDYQGQVNDEGEPHGRGTAHLESGAVFRGRFEHGLPSGRGSMERADGSTQRGNYVEGELEGPGVYEFSNGHCITFAYCQGTMHGPFEERAADGSLRCRGTMEEDRRTGAIEFWYEDGGYLQGHVDDEGQVTGDDFCYTYPDGISRLRGQWADEKMVSAVFETELSTQNAQAQIQSSGRGRLSPAELAELQPPAGRTFAYDPGNAQRPSSQPLLRDPYEAWRVEVRESSIGGRIGQGLFARREIAAGEVASFYAGLRCSHADVDSRDWGDNDNTMSLDADTVIDVSAEWLLPSQYCASLGNKANHSFTPNARYEPFTHPRFGEIKCLRASRAIPAGEEVTVHYDYNSIDPESGELEAPDWFKELDAAKGEVEPTLVHRVYRGLVWI